MPSDKGYLDFILDQLSPLDGVTYRAMMGEYIIYYNGKPVGGIYDDRFLIKPTGSAKRLLPDAALEAPYEGGKPMISVDRVDEGAFLCELVRSVERDLPNGKKMR